MTINKEPTDRSFGLLISTIFFVLTCYLMQTTGGSVLSYITLFAALIFLAIAFFAANLLNSIKKMWMRLGDFLGLIFTPLVMALIYFFLITPISVVTKLFGRDELRLKKNKGNTYWVKRVNVIIMDTSFKNQY